MGCFSETIGDSKNPLPSSIDQLDTIWIVVSDFVFLHYILFFDVTLRTSSKIITSEKQKEFSNVVETPKPKRPTKSGSTGPSGARGANW